MTIKKSLLAVATASAVAVAGAGVANAEDTPKPQLSAESSLDNFDLGEQLGAVFGSVDGETNEWDLGLGIKGLAALVAAGGAVTGSIMLVPSIDGAIKDIQAWASQYVG
ncbi:MAG: hypothetical protein L0K73_09720 [Corynebacterium variabile]|uniref:hypothetical protein n=1 Tax=Corynebacterium variabile TaxID=1727 RepID=UPI0026492A16|nr:hypothetical protein [Corynebacterium variabile]MDN6537067.1 hypothetical protein [Corynebacterium variabile]